MTLSEWLRKAREQLKQSGCPDPDIDGRWIAEDTLGMSTAELRFSGDRELSAKEADLLAKRLTRRLCGEPIQYILRSARFMGLDFYVDERVLIPRADTETLVEAVVADMSRAREGELLDLCTGSGCIGLSIKELLPHMEVTLADISAPALEVARKNAGRLGLSVTLRHGDLFRAVPKARFDCIVCNPPYVARADMPSLQREVTYEPVLALDGGEDGLDFYRRIIQELPQHLNSSGRVYFEVGVDEADAVLALLRERLHPGQSGVIDDLCGIPRVVYTRSE